jgi:outer membrane protein assembly factor BamA
MRSLLVLMILAAVAAGVLVHELPENEAKADTQVRRAQEIQSIAFDGRGLPVMAMRQLLASRTGELLDSAKLERDRAALQAFLEGRGFLAAHVEAPSVTFAPNGGAYVSFAIVQGPMFHVRNVRLVGASDQDGVVTIASGDDASAERIERARQALVSSLPLKAHKQATVMLKMHTDVAASAVDVELIAH